jgi:hypothetical protein
MVLNDCLKKLLNPPFEKVAKRITAVRNAVSILNSRLASSLAFLNSLRLGNLTGSGSRGALFLMYQQQAYNF